MNDTVIIVMAKQPQIGKIKTRMYPTLSREESANLYLAMLLDTLDLIINQTWAELAVAITPPDSRGYFKSITPSGTLLLPVEGRDIGDCLAKVLSVSLGMGFHKALAINSDGPSLPPEYLKLATAKLEQSDLVLGPGDDGGYYLVGMRHPHTAIFEGIDWSTQRVLSQTLERAASLGLATFLTPQWYDVDTFTDLLHLQKELESISPDRLPHSRRFLASFNVKDQLE